MTYEYNEIVDYQYYYNFCFAKTGRKEVFKKGQPGDEELLSLATEFAFDWISIGMMLNLTDLTLLKKIKKANVEKDEEYALLTKWKESLGYGASYQALAWVLDNRFINMYHLVKRYCRDKGK